MYLEVIALDIIKAERLIFSRACLYEKVRDHGSFNLV